jgi:hypothetical protein
MIIQSFYIQSGGVTFAVTDRASLDSEEARRRVNQAHARALAYAQEGAKCKARGLPDRQEIDNWIWAIFRGADFLGIFMLGSLTYVSGPWENLQTWSLTRPGTPAMFDAVPLPGVFGMTEDEEKAFTVEIFVEILRRPPRLLSGELRSVGINKLHYGIFKDYSDPGSERVKGQHAAVMADPRLVVTEAAHPTIVGLTIAEVTPVTG